MGNTLARSVIILEANNTLSPCQTGKSISAIHWVNEWSWSLTYTTVCTNRTVSRSLYKGGDNSGCQSYTNSQFFAVIGKATCSLMIMHCVLVKHPGEKNQQVQVRSCDYHVTVMWGQHSAINLPITEPWTICTLPKLSCIVRDFKSDPDCSMWMYMYSHYQMIGNQIWLPLLNA